MWNYESPNKITQLIAGRRSGLTLLEVVISTLIVGMMTVAALNGLGAATRSGDSAGNQAIALGLADDLLSEILATSYSDPSGTTNFGLESGEAAPRSNFDDVDDFNNWNQKPPQNADGTTIPDRTRFRRRVTVERVEPTNPAHATSGNTEQGAKRICVTVECNDVVLAKQYAVVTDNQQ